MNTPAVKTELQEKQAVKIAAINEELRLENIFFDLLGIAPSIVSPGRQPFAVFRPKTKEDYIKIIETIKPIKENFILTFSGKEPVKTFSPYSISYGGKHSRPDFMEVCIKFESDICPIWVKLPYEVLKQKFSVSTMQGDHKGFGRYETLYTLTANGGSTVQRYYGDNKTMYAATEEEKTTLENFIKI